MQTSKSFFVLRSSMKYEGATAQRKFPIGKLHINVNAQLNGVLIRGPDFLAVMIKPQFYTVTTTTTDVLIFCCFTSCYEYILQSTNVTKFIYTIEREINVCATTVVYLFRYILPTPEIVSIICLKDKTDSRL